MTVWHTKYGMLDFHYVSDYSELSSIAANIVADTITHTKCCNLGLPTGNTPIGMYSNLVNMNLDWSQVTTFNLDEYVGVTEHDSVSYQKYMLDNLHNHVTVKQKYFPSEGYDSLIDQAGGLDLTILGLGTNGHIAFNEPGSSLDSVTRIVNLDSSTIKRNSQGHDFTRPFPESAWTMGVKTILKSKRILLLVQGQNKLWVLKQALWSPVSSIITASYLQYHKDVNVYYCD